MTDLDFTGMSIAERNAFTVGELMSPLLNPDWREHDYTFSGENELYRSHVATADLMRLAEVGKVMLRRHRMWPPNRTTRSSFGWHTASTAR